MGNCPPWTEARPFTVSCRELALMNLLIIMAIAFKRIGPSAFILHWEVVRHDCGRLCAQATRASQAWTRPERPFGPLLGASAQSCDPALAQRAGASMSDRSGSQYRRKITSGHPGQHLDLARVRRSSASTPRGNSRSPT